MVLIISLGFVDSAISTLVAGAALRNLEHTISEAIWFVYWKPSIVGAYVIWKCARMYDIGKS